MVIQDLFVERKEEMEMKILLINRWSQLETVGGAERVFFRWRMRCRNGMRLRRLL